MNTETEYRRDGTFTMKGQIGAFEPVGSPPHVTVRPDTGERITPGTFVRAVDGSGVWRIDNGLLHTTFTNGDWEANVETRWEILSLGEKEFTYQRRMADRKGPVLKAVRKQ